MPTDHLTNDMRVDDRKYAAFEEYVRAYNDYRKAIGLYALWSPEERVVWKRLMMARKEYSKARKL